MYLIVGLGNPEPEYSKTRHNMGFDVINKIAEKYDTRPQNVLWCINKLINLMYFNTDSKVIGKYFNINKNDKLSTKAFIIGIARKIESERSILSYI